MSKKSYFALHSLDHPPNHLISLGQVITTPSRPWTRLTPPLSIPSEAIVSTTKNDWGTEVLRDRERRIGIWAQFAALILGVGADAVVSFSKRGMELFQFDELETSFFELDVEHVERRVVNNEVVAEWVNTAPFTGVPVKVEILAGSRGGTGEKTWFSGHDFVSTGAYIAAFSLASKHYLLHLQNDHALHPDLLGRPTPIRR